jgi:hypothetical protein
MFKLIRYLIMAQPKASFCDNTEPPNWSTILLEAFAISCYLTLMGFIWRNIYRYMYLQKRRMCRLQVFYIVIQLVVLTRMVQAMLLCWYYFYSEVVFIVG